MLRTDLQSLSRIRLHEARVLLVSANYSGAYYLTGIAVECALKARIARDTKQHEFPDKQRAFDCFIHDLAKLVKQAGLEGDLRTKCQAEPQFDVNWGVVKDWDVNSRYDFTVSKIKARAIYSAATSRRYGVMRWLRQNW